jgi:L-alanine-DL-glutamate epimerase-like enolase superfamily enzyme
MSVSRVAAVEVIPIVTPALNAADLDGAADTVIVRISDEEGRTGIGEADAPAELVRGFVEMPDSHLWSRGVRGLLLGRDPFELRALWEEVY